MHKLKGQAIGGKMRIFKNLFRSLAAVLAVTAAALFFAIAYADMNLSESYFVVEGTQLSIDCQVPITVVADRDESTAKDSAKAVKSEYDVNFKLLGLFPVSKANVNVIDSQTVRVLGTPFGIKLYTDGVLVVKVAEVESVQGTFFPAADAGIAVGDTIKTINGQKIDSNSKIEEIIKGSNGEELTVVFLRDNVIKTVKVKPILSKESGTYQIGVWVRDSTAGIGTLTFYSPATRVLCGLGHGLCDDDTEQLMTVGYGEIVASEIVSVVRGECGTPGELKGRLKSRVLGELLSNDTTGIYAESDGGFDDGELMSVAMKQEVKDGPAYIYTTVDGQAAERYICEIEVRKNHKNDSTHNLTVTITDTKLLEKTGGIVQGMSGSPIIQNGKLIGAVTHVFVNDPKKGYGIFAENMLDKAQSIDEIKSAS